MEFSSAPTWVNSLEALPSCLKGRGRTMDLLTTMVIDLNYHAFDTHKSVALDIRLATTQKTNDDWVKVASESTGSSYSSVHPLFQDTSNQFEFLVGYKNEKPVVAAVVFYEGSYASLYWVCTIPSERRQGLGTTL
ncbi:MAG: hypothetical protein Q8Q56_03660, partial [Alphaproteobacteria bacterium]|nr:hypothetical protein [Alphaproteobacteria bacterium]